LEDLKSEKDKWTVYKYGDQVLLCTEGVAHVEQMQALFFASSGTRPRTSEEKVAVMHQHLSGGVPVALAIS
jgi:hypothetical protein